MPVRLPARRFARLLLVFACILPLALPLGACGSCCNEPVVDTFWGNVFVDNLTDTGVPLEDVLTFFMAPVGGTFTGNLLPAPLPPGRSQFVGTFSENLYDAEADTELGDLVTWFEVFVGGADDVFFEVFPAS